MPDPDLRALCQAVVDARAAWCAEADEHESAARGVTYLGAQDALREFLGRDRPNDEDILYVRLAGSIATLTVQDGDALDCTVVLAPAG